MGTVKPDAASGGEIEGMGEEPEEYVLVEII